MFDCIEIGYFPNSAVDYRIDFDSRNFVVVIAVIVGVLKVLLQFIEDHFLLAVEVVQVFWRVSVEA